MLRSIEGKSFLIGGLLVLVAVCAMAMTGAPRMRGQYNGRFSLVTHDKDNGSVYVVDTLTGQVWERHYSNDDAFYASKLEGYGPEEPVDPNAEQP
jgi:hypothetical protein